MPIKIKSDPIPSTPVDQTPTESGQGSFHFLDALKKLAPAGIRTGAALLSAEGMWPGALISGAGEGLAQLAEDPTSLPSWKRMGVEATLGAIPFGKVFKAGKWVSSGLKSGALAGVGETGREIARGEKIDPKAIGLHTGIGAVTGGGLSKLLGLGGATKAIEKPVEDFIVEPTAQAGGQVLKAGGEGLASTQAPFKARDIVLKSEPAVQKSREIPYKFGELPATPPTPSGRATIPYASNGPATGKGAGTPTPYRAAGVKAQAAEDKAAIEAAARAKVNNAKAGRTAQEPTISESVNAPNANGVGSQRMSTKFTIPDDTQDAVSMGTQTPQVPINPGSSVARGDLFSDYAKSVEGPKPAFDWPEVGGRLEPVNGSHVIVPEPKSTSPLESLLTPEVKPTINPDSAVTPSYPSNQAANEAARAEASVAGPASSDPNAVQSGRNLERRLNDTGAPGGVDRRVVSEVGPSIQTVPESIPGQTSPSSGEVDELTNYLQGRLGSIPSKTGVSTVPTEGESALAQFFRTKAGATGKNYREAQGAVKAGDIPTADYARDSHLIELGRKPEGPLSTSAPSAPEVPTSSEIPSWITDQSKQVDEIQRLKDLANSEKGSLSPAALRGLMGVSGAAIGAPIGAANADEEHKVQGGITGGLIGGGLGLAGPSIANGIQHPELISEGLQNAFKKIPAIQRANLLTSAHGLPANAFAGPYGSAVFGSLEKGLSGDPRGWEALKHANPVSFLRQALPQGLGGSSDSMFNEARGLIGRAEGTSLDQASNKFDRALAVPGTLMTSGDLAAKDMLERGGGFSPAETREMTLTSEPITNAGRNIANLSKKSPLLQFMFPFSRTTTNIAEQGAMRTPGLGFITHHAMEKVGRPADTLRTKLVQQGMGGAIGLGSGVIGANLDPDTAKIAKRYVSNAAGQYSLPASIGFSAGQALAQGKHPIVGGAKELTDALPLPSARPITDVIKGAFDFGDFLQGNKGLNEVKVPHSAYPAVLRELGDVSLPSFGRGDQTQPDVNQPGPNEPIIRFRR